MSIIISDIPKKTLAKGIKGRYVHTKNITIGIVDIEKGAVLPEHSHFHEQTTQVTSGKLEMTIDGITKILEQGTIALIPSNVAHSALAVTDCVVTDIFFPVREDYK